MLLKILDALGVQQLVVARGQEAPVDKSGTITSTGVAQVAIAANALRSGFRLQNVSNNPMHLNDAGTATTGAGSFLVAAGAFFPPEGYPTTTGAISIIGTAGDAFTAREW